jgi:GT2 family glycosyltransferase
MNENDVVVVIVTYKSAALTIDCLSSVEAERMATSGLKIRAIVVDNASGDAPEIARAIATHGWSPWVTLIESPRNGGFAYGNNIAFQRAYADGPPAYFHLVNPDSVLRKGAIAALVDFLEKNPEVGIAGGSSEISDGVDWPYAFRFPSLLGDFVAGVQLRLATRALSQWIVIRRMSPVRQRADWIGGASMMVRRQVVDCIGGLDESYFLYFEETDFCLRAKNAGFSTWYVPESRVLHFGQQSTKAAKDGERPKRLPGYWFDSRCHYFAANHGMRYAIATDIVALLAHSFGSLKRRLRGRIDQGVPHFLGDFLQHSLLRRKNRRRAAVRQIPRFTGGEATPREMAAAGTPPKSAISIPDLASAKR